MPKRPVRQYTLFPNEEQPTLFEMVIRTAGFIAILLFLILYFSTK